MKHIIWTLSLALILSSCSTINPPTTPAAPTTAPQTTWADRQIALNNIKSWHLSGKIAVQTSKDSGSASVDWTQRQHGYTISLLGPLGTNGIKLSGQPGHVTLQTSDGKSYNAKSPEQLLAAQWGFHLPVSNMNYWIRGLPAPGMAATTSFDHSGRLETLIQQGWRIDYLSYSNTGRTELPEKLSITSAALKVKIIVYQWSVA